MNKVQQLLNDKNGLTLSQYALSVKIFTNWIISQINLINVLQIKVQPLNYLILLNLKHYNRVQCQV